MQGFVWTDYTAAAGGSQGRICSKHGQRIDCRAQLTVLYTLLFILYAVLTAERLSPGTASAALPRASNSTPGLVCGGPNSCKAGMAVLHPTPTSPSESELKQHRVQRVGAYDPHTCQSMHVLKSASVGGSVCVAHQTSSLQALCAPVHALALSSKTEAYCLWVALYMLHSFKQWHMSSGTPTHKTMLARALISGDLWLLVLARSALPGHASPASGESTIA